MCLKLEQIFQCSLKYCVQSWKNDVQMASLGIFQDLFFRSWKYVEVQVGIQFQNFEKRRYVSSD